jgi:hypothetical protein
MVQLVPRAADRSFDRIGASSQLGRVMGPDGAGPAAEEALVVGMGRIDDRNFHGRSILLPHSATCQEAKTNNFVSRYGVKKAAGREVRATRVRPAPVVRSCVISPP